MQDQSAMRSVAFLLALVFLIALCPVARADQVFLVTEYACHPKGRTFILTTHAFDSEDGRTDSTPGFRKIAYGVAHISCKLGSHTLRALVDLSGYFMQGECAEGMTTVRRMSVDGMPILPPPELHFFWECGDRPLIEIRVKATTTGLLLEKCGAEDPVWGSAGRPLITCESAPMKVDRGAAKWIEKPSQKRSFE